MTLTSHRLLSIGALLLAFNISADSLHAESRWHKVLRRSLTVAAGSLSIADGAQTAAYVHTPGVRESNPLGSGAGLWSIKAVMIAMPIVVGEWRYKRPQSEALGTNLALFGSAASSLVFGMTLHHNAAILSEVK